MSNDWKNFFLFILAVDAFFITANICLGCISRSLGLISDVFRRLLNE